MYAALFVMLLMNYLVPLRKLLAAVPVLRYISSSFLVFSPIFLANLIFAQTFKGEEGTAATALGANITGPLFGGMC